MNTQIYPPVAVPICVSAVGLPTLHYAIYLVHEHGNWGPRYGGQMYPLYYVGRLCPDGAHDTFMISVRSGPYFPLYEKFKVFVFLNEYDARVAYALRRAAGEVVGPSFECDYDREFGFLAVYARNHVVRGPWNIFCYAGVENWRSGESYKIAA